MATTLSSTVVAASIIGGMVSNIDLQANASTISKKFTATLTNGTGASKACILWSDTRTLAASATEDLDLASGLTDAFGATIVFTKVKAILVTAAAANTNLVVVSCPAANGFVTPFNAASDAIKIYPGGAFMLVNPTTTGYAVTASTGDLLTITNSAGSTGVTYDIVIIGEV